MELVWIGRVLLAGLLGALIGFERQYHYKEAGLRTHFLVGVGSSTLMVISKYAFIDVLGTPGVELDPSRVASLVVSGVGFIGAGTIIFRRNVIHGLTTAAGLWATSAVGLAVGAGLYGIGVMGTAIILAGLVLLDYAASRILPAPARRVIVSIFDRPGEIGRLGTALGQLGVNIGHIEVGQPQGSRMEVDMHVHLPLEVSMAQVVTAVAAMDGMRVIYCKPDPGIGPRVAGGSERDEAGDSGLG